MPDEQVVIPPDSGWLEYENRSAAQAFCNYLSGAFMYGEGGEGAGTCRYSTVREHTNGKFYVRVESDAYRFMSAEELAAIVPVLP